jgi:chromosome partitioning protein
VRIVAVINQKGGVGKTTTVANLGAALAAAGRDVLLIDLDPQAHLTLHLGLEPGSTETSMYELLTGEAKIEAAAHPVAPHLWLAPSAIDLAAAEVELVGTVGREQILRDRLRAAPPAPSHAPAPTDPPPGEPVPATGATAAQQPCAGPASDSTGASSHPWHPPAPAIPAAPFAPERCDFALIDCPPSLGLLTLNALAAADDVLIPLQPHFLALQGMGKLLETVTLVQRRINPGLAVRGVVLCLYETGTKLAAEVVEDLQKFFTASRAAAAPWAGAKIFETLIRRNVKLAESPSHGKTIFDYEPHCRGADDYRALAEEFLALYAPPAPTPANQETSRDTGDEGDRERQGGGIAPVPALEPAPPQQATK